MWQAAEFRMRLHSLTCGSMSITDYQTIMLPLLKLASDGREHTKHEAEGAFALHFQLTAAERETPFRSGRQRLFDSRVGWATTYLKQAGLDDSRVNFAR